MARTILEIEEFRDGWSDWCQDPDSDIDVFLAEQHIEEDISQPYVVGIYRDGCLDCLLIARISTERMGLSFGGVRMRLPEARILRIVANGYLGHQNRQNSELLVRALIDALSKGEADVAQGTRIRSVHGERPKCLIMVDDKTILDHQIEGLLLAGIDQIAIVVGYEQQQIVGHVRARYPGLGKKIDFIENATFAITNNIYSLWLARVWLQGDSFVCLNGDVIFDAQILRSALGTNAPVSMIVDPEWRDETMKVIISDGRVIQMSKKISKEEFSGTYIGITVFNEGVYDKFFYKMRGLIQLGRVNEFFNVAVQELADEGLKVGFTTTARSPWAEIDDPLDLTFAQKHIFPQLGLAASV